METVTFESLQLPPPPNWWEDFFRDIVLDVWRAAVPESQTREEAEFIRLHLKTPPPARLLDVPCGNGRLARALAAAGYRAAGLDLAPDFIAEARANSTGQGGALEWALGDMRKLPWRAEFDGAFCFGNCFGYMSDEDNEMYLKSVSQALKPGARFILDTHMAAESLFPSFKEHLDYSLGGIRFVIDNAYDPVRGRLDTIYTFERDGRSERRAGAHRIYTCSELHQLFREAGFDDMVGYGSLKSEPFKLGATELLLIGTRQ